MFGKIDIKKWRRGIWWWGILATRVGLPNSKIKFPDISNKNSGHIFKIPEKIIKLELVK